MNAPVIPARVIEFLAENIDTVPQLEAMLLLWQAPNSRWSVEELAVRLYVSKEEAAAIIRALQMRALIVSDGQPNAYRHHLIDITKFIHSRASSAVRAFARAFDLKRDR